MSEFSLVWSHSHAIVTHMVIFARDKIRGCSVETLGKNKLITSTCTFLDLDMLVVTNEDLDFDVPFEIRATCDTTLGAFATWFDTSFEHNCSSPVLLTTSPEEPYTHWQQTVFYLFEVPYLSRTFDFSFSSFFLGGEI